MNSERPLLLLLDANALIHRAFHALQTPLSVSKTGEITGAVYGFTSMLLKGLGDLKPAYVAAAFDRAAPTFRHVQYEAYKAQRPKTPDELIGQFGRVREVLATFGIQIYEVDGFEADDVIGTLAEQAKANGLDVVVVTGDADALQLVDNRVRILTLRKGLSDTVLYDEAGVTERYGIGPNQIPDFKALKGDPSDNIPGVPGVGEKTAVKLLQELGSLDGIYQNLDGVKPPKIQETLRTNEGLARRCLDLATIVRDAPVQLDLEACRFAGYDRPRVVELFRELEFRSLLPRLPASTPDAETERRGDAESERRGDGETRGRGDAETGGGGVSASPRPPVSEAVGPGAGGERQLSLFAIGEASAVMPAVTSMPAGLGAGHKIVTSPDQLERLIRRLAQVPSFVLDLETTALDPIGSGIVGVALCPAPGETCYVPVGHRTYDPASPAQLPLQQVLDQLAPLLADPAKPKVAHNGKFDLTVLAEHGVSVANLAFDTMIAAYLLNESAVGLKDLTFARFGIELAPISNLIGTGSKQISMADVPAAAAAAYACAQVDATYRLRDLFGPELRENDLWALFTDVEMPLVPVLVAMERAGVKLDTATLREISQHLGRDLARLEIEIYNQVGHQFNINSTQQLAQILFHQLKLPSGRKTSFGYSTNQAVLEDLRGAHPIIDLILEHRQLKKLKSTYVDALPALIHPKTGRVHTSFNQTVASTGRLSSSDPNLQNIPIRTELGRQFRRAFVAESGCVLLSADYSQIELRILAHITRDPLLVEAFANNQDIHATTAAAVYGVPLSAVTPEQRNIAKRMNFAVAYGVSEFGLSQSTGLSRRDAGAFISDYFKKYPGVRAYLEATKREARARGYVQTLLGRRRYIPEMQSPNPQLRQAGERMAINMPIQGTSADIIKIAMIRLHQALPEQNLHGRMTLQVHDELVFEVPEAEVAPTARLVKEIMEGAMPLSVPVKVDVSAGLNWDEQRAVMSDE